MKQIILMITLVFPVFFAGAQTRIELYRFIKQYIPDSSAGTNYNAYYSKVMAGSSVKWDAGSPADKKSGTVYLTFKDADKDVSNIVLTKANGQYKRIEIMSNISSEAWYTDIKSFFQKNPYSAKSLLECGNMMHEHAYELKLPGKNKVWFTYWYETGNGYGDIHFSIYLYESDVPKNCDDVAI